MVQSKKFRGVRQHHWGSWVSEIRHPLLKRRVWLGTFDTAEEATRAYDQAVVLMSGRNAKTNFPLSLTPNGESRLRKGALELDHNPSDTSTSPDQNELSEFLHAKLRKCSKIPSPSMTCLRIDTEKAHIGVWQKRAGQSSDSKWIMTVHRGKGNVDHDDHQAQLSSESSHSHEQESKLRKEMDEEERNALQMIEEMLNRNNSPSPPAPSPSFREDDFFSNLPI